MYVDFGALLPVSGCLKSWAHFQTIFGLITHLTPEKLPVVSRSMLTRRCRGTGGFDQNLYTVLLLNSCLRCTSPATFLLIHSRAAREEVPQCVFLSSKRLEY
jgi:hypothetical protein